MELVVDLQVLVVGVEGVVGMEGIIMILEVEECHLCLLVVDFLVVMHCEKEEEEEEEEECDMMPHKQTTSHLQS